MPRLDSIHLYPIKSTAGMALTRALVTEEGLLGDRRYMVTKPDGTFITARTHPQLQQIVATPTEAGLQLHYPGLTPLNLQELRFSRVPQRTGVWHDSFDALRTQPEADEWLSRVLGEPARLLWLGETSARFRDETGTRVSFADGYPLLLIGQGSLDDLNLRSDALHQMSQFRTNLVATGTQPFEEDSWKRIRIGEVEFLVAKPCSRCIMTTIEPGSTRFNARQEPLATLLRYRRGPDGKVDFGQNLVALNEGWIEAGSEIEVLERVRPPVYPDEMQEREVKIRPVRASLTRPLQGVQLRIGEQSFAGNNQGTVLDQAHKQGLDLPWSCRAGICGSCKQTLLAGEVDHPDAPAITAAERAEGKILACCAVPLTDLVIK